ncbi:hypothetical protein [Vibrio sp. MEBiC08052]|uniref:hypothetical protein n=1 Tax=Vibrio sp. MEBiC08052 TaxID=1761910 RepID=UPI00074061B6|nr:hypothetical protein [Vibrio sp. MEBiC08052]KUI99665.1 hypothetical protein VRK_11110 [Vibrio sp. MEBiC08052]
MMKAELSQCVAFFQLDEPPASVAHSLQPYSCNLIARLKLDHESIWLVDLNRETVSFEQLQRVSCIVFAGLWPIRPRQIERHAIRCLVSHILHLGIPVLFIGSTERFLFEALGYESFMPTSRFGLNMVQPSNMSDRLTTSHDLSWGWVVNDMVATDFTADTVVLERDLNGMPMLICHAEHIYSSSAALGVTWHEMASWLYAYPEHLQGNEAIIEHHWSDDEGLTFIQQFIQRWYQVSDNACVH